MADTQLLHSDQCLQDFKRYGFCEHTILPRPTPPAPRRPYRVRHPWRFELFSTAACAAIVYGNLRIIGSLGLWHGTLVICTISLGSVVLLALGPPTWFTLDPRRILPPNARLND